MVNIKYHVIKIISMMIRKYNLQETRGIFVNEKV